MKHILVFKTSADETMKRLFRDLKEEDVDCFIQSSLLNRYRAEYPDIHFIDICKEGFYDLPSEVINKLSEKMYDRLYVTFSGVKGHNYGNVMELVCKAHFKRAFFYNCNGNVVEMPKEQIIKDTLCRIYIKWIEWFYELGRGHI